MGRNRMRLERFRITEIHPNDSYYGSDCLNKVFRLGDGGWIDESPLGDCMSYIRGAIAEDSANGMRITFAGVRYAPVDN